VFLEPDAVVVLGGMHRVAIARALGCTHVPCLAIDLDEAQDFYRYPEGQL
jgi:ParB-like chromosome segregation protein Spo0J